LDKGLKVKIVTWVKRMKVNHEDIIATQTRRVFNVLARRFLMLLEDLQHDHINNFDKLRQNFPEFEFLINQADYFDDSKFGHFRKRVLDIANDAFRELDDELKKYKMELRRE
jgi:hypothetical protein